MSRRVRNRVTATALGGLLLGAALLTTGTASADQVEGGGWQVVFGGGGVLGISCRSTPSVESMVVPAEGPVRWSTGPVAARGCSSTARPVARSRRTARPRWSSATVPPRSASIRVAR